MVLRNVAKTFSLEEQRQEINEIAVDLDAVNTTLTNWNASQWDTAYGWGDHAQAGYWVDNSTSRTNWDTAYGWGDHGTAGYLVATSASYNNANWDTAYGWGDHAQGGYLTAYQTDAQIKTSYEANADTNAFTDALLTKLNGIETGATADQTDAEIKTAYENNADTNAFTDAEQTKLAGIADGAEVNLAPGGTYAGTGTAQDPAIGSIQFKNFGNIFGGDSLFTYDNTNNRLSIGASSGSAALNVVRPGATSVDTAYFHASDSGANNRIRINTVANQGGHPYIKFDAGGSNFVVGELYAGTTDNKLVLGVGEDPTGVTGISIDGNGNVTANNLALDQTNTSATDAAATSTVLDHYEEGTWTPIWGSTTGSITNITYDVQSGWYTRIGRVVYVSCRLRSTATDTSGAGGGLLVAGLPFVARTPQGTGAGAAYSLIDFPAGTINITTEVRENTTQFYAGLYTLDNGNFGNIGPGSLQSSGNSEIRVSFFYMTDS